MSASHAPLASIHGADSASASGADAVDGPPAQRAAGERARVRADREARRAARAAEREGLAAERDRKKRHVDDRLAEVARLNQEVAARLEELSGLLAAGVRTSPTIDLDAAKRATRLPTFDPGPLAVEEPPPRLALPRYIPPVFSLPHISLLQWILPGGHRRFERQVRAARASHQRMLGDLRARFDEEVRRLTDEHRKVAEAHAGRTADREHRLRRAEEGHRQLVEHLEREVAKHNRRIDGLRRKLEGAPDEAVLARLAAAVSRTPYPASVPLRGTVAFARGDRRVVLEREVPPFDVVPSVARYRYVKARDEITSSAMAPSKRRSLYHSVLGQLALRMASEAFAADPVGNVDVVEFTGYRPKARRGRNERKVILASVTIARQDLDRLDLPNVDPLAAIKRLKGLLTKDPEGLAPVVPPKGIGPLKLVAVLPASIAERPV